MYDFDLQVRFWRGVTDAMMHNTEALLAASSEWQDKVLAANSQAESAAKTGARRSGPQSGTSVFGFAALPSLTPAPSTGAAANPFAAMWWLAPWQQQYTGQLCGQPSKTGAQPGAAVFNLLAMNPFFDMNPFVSQWFETYWRNATSVWTGQPKQANLWGFGLQPATEHPFAAFWPFPVSAWSYMQMPLTAAMMSAGMPYKVASPSAKASTAALDAAQAAKEQMEKVYSAYRSDGGHAAAQIIALPWTLAASFFDAKATDLQAKSAA